VKGTTLGLCLAVIALLTVVLPPLAAKDVHARRIAREQAEARRTAALVASGAGGVVAAARGAGDQLTIWRGAGSTPAFAAGIDWPAGRTVVTPTIASDIWGNQLFIVVAVGVDAGATPRVLVLSAGPNGVVETPVAASWPPRGDDIAATAAR
jgi:hypothetical protein